MKYFWRVYYIVKDIFSKKPKHYTGIGKSETVIRYCRTNGKKYTEIRIKK